MKNLPKLGLACLLLSFLIAQPSLSAQQVILINGEATEVILSGDQIKTIVTAKLKNYMEQYGQETDDKFVKSLVRINKKEEPEAAKPIAISTSSYRKKSIQEVKETAMVLAHYPQE